MTAKTKKAKVEDTQFDAIKSAQKTATEQFSKIRDTASENFQKVSETLQDTMADVTDKFSNVHEATTQAGEILKQSGATAAKGTREFDTEVFNFARDSVASSVENVKAVSAVKSFQELAALQTSFLFNRMEETNKHLKSLADISVKTWTDAATPITEAVAKVTDKKAA